MILVEPVETVVAVGGGVAGPGEDPDREKVAVRQLHQAEVLVDHLRGGLPLVGVVVAAVEQLRPAFKELEFLIHCVFLLLSK